MLKLIAIFLTLVVLGPPVGGQSLPLRARTDHDMAMYDSSAAAIVERLQRSGTTGGWIVDIMRQVDKAQSSAKLGAIADSISVGMIEASKGNNGRWPPAGPSWLTLVTAGKVISTNGGTPFVGTLDRLIRMHQDAIGTDRIRVLFWLPEVVGADSALKYLSSVARSGDETAVHAMSALIGATTRSDYRPASTIEPALALLRQLFDENAVQRPDAKRSLEFFAVSRGWKRYPVGEPLSS